MCGTLFILLFLELIFFLAMVQSSRGVRLFYVLGTCVVFILAAFVRNEPRTWTGLGVRQESCNKSRQHRVS